MGIRDLFVLTLQLFESDYFKTKSEKAKHKGNLPPASPMLGPPPTSQHCAHPDPAPPRREGVGGWGRAAHAQCRGPPPRLREVTLAHPGPRPPRQPLAAAGDRLPWPLRAAVFSGSWGASCCSRPRPFRAPWFGAPRPSPPLRSSGRPAAAAGASVRASRPAARLGLPLSAARSSAPGGALVSARCRCLQSVPGFALLRSSRLLGTLPSRLRPPPCPALSAPRPRSASPESPGPRSPRFPSPRLPTPSPLFLRVQLGRGARPSSLRAASFVCSPPSPSPLRDLAHCQFSPPFPFFWSRRTQELSVRLGCRKSTFGCGTFEPAPFPSVSLWVLGFR